MSKTRDQYQNRLQDCKDVFIMKHKDYGSAWRILRLTSLTDQMYIKASRIRSIESTGQNRVGESIKGEFEALVNYGIMANIQIRLGGPAEENMELTALVPLYEEIATSVYDLMLKKNHDYGEAWRDMRISSMTDLILVKLLRIKQIEDNEGHTDVSEGIDANYLDIINYALFALIKISEEENNKK